MNQLTGTAELSAINDKKSWYLTIWRWHFYMGLYVVPFLIMLSVTGLLMMYIVIFNGRYSEGTTVAVSGTPISLSEQTNIVQQQFPQGRVTEWIKPRSADGVSVFHIKSDDVTYVTTVNPFNGEVLDTWVKNSSLYEILDNIHGELLVGKVGDRMIEIAAGFALLLVISGVYLSWPRNGRTFKSMLVPNLLAKKRELWKSLHITVGVYLSIILLAFLLTGMAWTGVWGGKFVQAWNTFPIGKYSGVPLSKIETHADMNDTNSKTVPWGLEQTPMPVSGSHAGNTGLPEGEEINLDNVAKFAQTIGYDGRFRIRFPKSNTGVWTINQNSMGADSTDPRKDRTMHIDQYTGKILADITFEDYSLAAKSMGYGIAFHEGFMGLWNIILNTVFCLSMVFLSLSGVVMWWQRRPKSAGRLVAPPIPATVIQLRKGLLLIILAMSLLFPMVGATLLTILLLDFVVLSRIPAFKQFFA